jgi:hypothetical protein
MFNFEEGIRGDKRQETRGARNKKQDWKETRNKIK